VQLADQLSFLPEAGSWASLARQRFAATLRGRLAGSEGLWLEHSTGYHFLVMRLAARFEEASGEPGAFTDELAAMRTAAGWLVMPSRRLIPYGDSRDGAAAPWAIAEAADDSGLHVFSDSGLAVVKDGGGYLAVTAGFHNTTHKHADELGFQLYDRGRDVISDSGFSDYNADRWRQFSRSVQAHSVLTIRDWEFPIDKPEVAYGSGIVAAGEGDGWYAIEARNPLLRSRGARHRRLFLYRPGRALLVLDRVRSRRHRTYTRLFQVASGMDAVGRGPTVGLKASGFNGALRDDGRHSTRSKVKGQYTPPRGWTFPAGKGRVPRWTIRYQSRAAAAWYLTAIGLRGAARASLARVGKRSLELRVGGPALATSRLEVSRAGDRLTVRRQRGGHRSR
jgi:hypothetical protein